MVYIRTPEQRHAEYLRGKDKALARAKKWAAENPEKRREIVKRNNAKSSDRKREWHQLKRYDNIIEKTLCVVCLHSPDDVGKLVIHHIDGNNGKLGKLLNNDKDNLAVLCKSCHPKVHNRWGLKWLTV